ncbi:isopenicillin N synthase family dioxygenase [Congregibacter sp.]|uniref:isopenicillin N synthase family dioxygenase n=1 Tax=Congregibacter sp. TaxID=2744308 RepID=UPI003F6C6A08
MEVPLIDCDHRARTDPEVARDIDRALRDVGFMAVHNLGVTPERIREVFDTARRFFQSPEEEKLRCAYAEASENFGYQSLGQESLDPSSPADLKETFTMRNLLSSKVAVERWPDNDFRESVSTFFDDALAAAQRLQRLLALALKVSPEFFVERHNGENISLRLLYYPPVMASEIDPEQMGAGAHTDYGMLTLLFQDAVGGLQVQSETGSWHDVPPRPDAIVINSGDLLERWSNGRYRSTCHRVLPREQGVERYSIALFVDPDSDTRVEVLPSCIPEGAAALYPPVTAGEHVQAKIEATHGA